MCTVHLFTEYTAFLQAVLSTDVPKTLKIAITSSSHTLPTSSSQSTKSSSLRLWTVRDGKWGVIPVNSKDRSKSLKDVISGHIKRLGYPAIVSDHFCFPVHFAFFLLPCLFYIDIVNTVIDRYTFSFWFFCAHHHKIFSSPR